MLWRTVAFPALALMPVACHPRPRYHPPPPPLVSGVALTSREIMEAHPPKQHTSHPPTPPPLHTHQSPNGFASCARARAPPLRSHASSQHQRPASCPDQRPRPSEGADPPPRTPPNAACARPASSRSSSPPSYYLLPLTSQEASQEGSQEASQEGSQEASQEGSQEAPRPLGASRHD